MKKTRKGTKTPQADIFYSPDTYQAHQYRRNKNPFFTNRLLIMLNIILIAINFKKYFHYCCVQVHTKAYLLYTAWQ